MKIISNHSIVLCSIIKSLENRCTLSICLSRRRNSIYLNQVDGISNERRKNTIQTFVMEGRRGSYSSLNEQQHKLYEMSVRAKLKEKTVE